MKNVQRKRSKVWSLVVLVITAAVTGKILWSIDDWGRDLSTNHARLDDAAKDPRLHRPIVNQSVSQTRDEIVRWIERQSRWKVVSLEDQGDSVSMHLTRTTPLMRFVDDIHLTLQADDPTGTTTRIDAKSQSRLGQGDLGQNPRNLIELSESWRRD